MLKLEGVTKRYPGSQGPEAVRELNLEVAPGQFLCLVGASGCGKTTTLRLMAGLETPNAGRITLEGRPVAGPGPERCVVFQRYTLFPWRTVLDNVAFGLEMQGMPRGQRRERARHYLELVGLGDWAAAHPGQLSGGMRQRVAVARAVAAGPKVLLMDEPFGALDARTRQALQGQLIRLWQENRTTIVFVTHSINEALLLAGRVVVMRGGPGRVALTEDVDLPRPRDRHAPDFRGLHAAIYAALGSD